MIKTLAVSVFLYALVATLIAFATQSMGFALSVALGGFSMGANITALAFMWRLIFSKKSIALAVLVIIFKYLILALILWSLASIKWLSPVGFAIGLSALLFGVLVVLLKNSLSKKA